MARSSDRGVISRVVGGCFALLAAAVALFIAVRLLEAVWPWLLGIALAAVAGTTGLAVLRHHHRGW